MSDMSKIFKLDEPTPEGFFETVIRYGFPQSGKTDKWTYISSYHIENVFHVVQMWINHLIKWDATFIARGPVETEEPLIYAQGDLVYQSYNLAFIRVTGARPGYSAGVRIEPQYIDMIKVSIDDEDNIRVVFFLQVGPAKE